MSDTFETSKDVGQLKQKYFNDPARRIQLKKGATLVVEGMYNDRLYVILDGMLTGYLSDENGDQIEVYQSKRDMFVGVYSYFSKEHLTYLTLIADEDTTVAYIDQSAREGQAEVFARDFLPVMVHELYLRQMLTQRFNLQRQAAIRKLFENEKMATLGQLAAGLAHELNNAIGVLDNNTSWLASTIKDILKNKTLRNLFLTMLESGQSLSTVELREKRKSLESKFGVPASIAKQLAKTSLTEDEVRSLLKENQDELDRISLLTEAAITLHDMQVAATHAAHVVQSVRILGMNNSAAAVQTSLLETINKAMALTKSLWQDIAVSVRQDAEAIVIANPGDLVQIWVNLIKNACESMSLAQTQSPSLSIQIKTEGDYYQIIVTDNGPGIPEALQKKIFQPNFTTRVSGLSFGLGLGLSIVRKIVTEYRGSVQVESRAGETRFEVQLPKP